MNEARKPRVLLISQWPKVKNAEYELIERIRRTGFDIGVVDYLGFDVDSGRCINDATLAERYDFAVSFHYDTPKFLNLPTLLWVANPLEFMHAQPAYRTRLIQHLRAYDDYAYNRSDLLLQHIRKVVGSRWRDTGLTLIGACSRNALIAPDFTTNPPKPRIFYCGVNWEALSDRAGRAQGLLENLQAKDAADFYGPEKLLGRPTWGAFPNYKCEVPFDGASIFTTMHEYAAVLHVSSPAHLKSRTSSGRAVEGFAAGVPVISDENPHVRHQFGDLPYYFRGETEAERAEGALAALDAIRTRPQEALERVRAAQALISEKYCYEACLEHLRDAVASGHYGGIAPRAAPSQPVQADIDVFLFHHDPYRPEGEALAGFANEAHLEAALARVPQGVRARLRRVDESLTGIPALQWDRMRLGAKVAHLAGRAEGTHAMFLTQHDFPHHDHFTKMGEWLSIPAPPGSQAPNAFVAGFYANDLSKAAPHDSGAILRNSSSNSLYRWSQDSIAEHQLGTLCLDRALLARCTAERLGPFDVLAPVAILLECLAGGGTLERSRYVTLRVSHGHYHRYLDAFERISRKGYWAQQMELVSNASHEINALYDAFHEDATLVAIADRISGHDLPPNAAIDPAIREVNAFLDLLRPWWRKVLAVRRALSPSAWFKR